MTTALLYITVSTGLYYLFSRAVITHGIWSRYPPAIDHFMLCAACSGTWWGAAAAATIGIPLDLPLLGLPGASVWAVVAGAFLGMVWTPILGWIMIRAWMELSTTDDDTESPSNVTPISKLRK